MRKSKLWYIPPERIKQFRENDRRVLRVMKQRKDAEMFRKRSKKQKITYDKTGKIPVIRASICTGEKVAGFKDEKTGKFDDLMLIRNTQDFQEFLCRYQVEETEIKREW